MLFNGDTVGMLLGDMGADVIKVESPGQGDYLRDMLGQIVPHHSPAHLQVNKNKRSLTLDLRRTDGPRRVLGPVAHRRCVRRRLPGRRLRQPSASATPRRRDPVKPGIVYCHYSGFGATGPYARIPTHGQMMNARSPRGVPLGIDGDGLVRRAAIDRVRWGARRSAAMAPPPAAVHAARGCTWSPRWSAGGEDRRGPNLDAAGSDGVVAQGWIGATYGLNYDRITDRHRAAPAGRHRADERQVQLLRDGRRPVRAVLRHRAQVLAAALRVVERPRISSAATTWAIAGRLRPPRRGAAARAAGDLRHPQPGRGIAFARETTGCRLGPAHQRRRPARRPADQRPPDRRRRRAPGGRRRSRTSASR